MMLLNLEKSARLASYCRAYCEQHAEWQRTPATERKKALEELFRSESFAPRLLGFA